MKQLHRLQVAIACVVSLGASTNGALADIPPPQHFIMSSHAKSEATAIIIADNSISNGMEAHPPGAVFDTRDLCGIVIDVFAGAGANAVLNIMGSASDAAEFGGEDGWSSEGPPIKIVGANKLTTYVPLRHDTTEFFLSLPDRPHDPDVNGSIGGAIKVYGTAISCNTG